MRRSGRTLDKGLQQLLFHRRRNVTVRLPVDLRRDYVVAGEEDEARDDGSTNILPLELETKRHIASPDGDVAGVVEMGVDCG